MSAAQTGRGRPSRLPRGGYSPPESSIEWTGELEVDFLGLDDRRRVFDASRWPAGPLRSTLVEAFHTETHFGGGSRTLSSADDIWRTLRRFALYFHDLDVAIHSLGDVSVKHLQDYKSFRLSTTAEDSVRMEFANLRRILTPVADKYGMNSLAFDYLGRRWPTRRRSGVGGYDDAVFEAILRAARSDVANIRQRLRTGRGLVERFRRGELAPDDDPVLASILEEAATGGRVSGIGSSRSDARLAIARRIFLTYDDLAPLLILLVALSGMNPETAKELPAKHEVEMGLVLKFESLKRRRGSGNWKQRNVWDIGPESRSLHRAAGVYLLAHELSSWGREFADTDRLWVVWTNPSRDRAPHHFAWHSTLGQVPLKLGSWAASHRIEENGEPLSLSFNALRTTVLRRNAKEVGGHMPTAAKSNSQAVLFTNYLSGDRVVQDWAADTVTSAFEDLEDSVRKSRAVKLGDDWGRPDSSGVAAETALLACRDTTNGQADGGPCLDSALTCFSCRNAVIGEVNLPAILQLRDSLQERWHETPATKWWDAFGNTWVAINEDILPNFTSAEVEAARLVERSPIPLEILEKPWPR